MCGIAGIVSKNKSFSLNRTIFSLSQSIKHRGPDGEGFLFINNIETKPAFSPETPPVNKQNSDFLFNPSISIDNISNEFDIALAHRRLSIIDLTVSGHQPMSDSTGEYWITFNGEVYNYIELKNELITKGHQFITHSDTEVVIACYKEWGYDCVSKFNGMFAFVIYDKKRNELFCARDRAGVKPFYFIDTTDCFSFASEQKAFIKSHLIKFEVNAPQQFDFLQNAHLEGEEESLFKGIKELKPSHVLIYSLNNHQTTIKKYYTIPEVSALQKSDNELISLIEEKLIHAIKIRLRSDVSVGSCLSGGLDSSIIAGVMNYLQPNNNLHLFTATFPNELYDESKYAKQVADNLHASWHTVTPNAEEFFYDLEKVIFHQDLPIWTTSTYSQHRVMQLASEQNIKVVLDGQGADEIFGGYSHHYMALWKENFSFTELNNSKPTIKNPYQLFAKQLIKEVFNIKPNYDSFFNSETNKLTKKNSSQKIPNTLNHSLSDDYQGRLKSFLKCEDRCSMAFGIESRVPFSDDIELVDLLFSIKGSSKIQLGVSKYLLREASKSFIPKSIYERRDKVGFDTPVEKWLLPYKNQILDTITSELDFVNKSYLENNIDDLLKTKSLFLFRLFSLATWQHVFANTYPL